MQSSSPLLSFEGWQEVQKSTKEDANMAVRASVDPNDDLEPLPPGYELASDAVVNAFESLEADPNLANALDIAAQKAFSAAQGFLPNAAFRNQLVEQNLLQSAALLQRCLGTRAEWLAERDRAISSLRDAYEIARAIITHRAETTSGYYGLDLAEVNHQSSAEYAIEVAINASNDQLDKARSDSSYTKDSLEGFALQVLANSVQEDPSIQRKLFFDLKAVYEGLNVGYRRDRASASRRSAAQSVITLAQQGDPASYFDAQLAVLNQRFADDFASILDRIGALSFGLKQIYNYSTPLPGPDTKQPFDDILDWIRKAGEFLVRFGTSEQTYVISISVRAIQSVDSWNAGLSSDGRSGAWEFDLVETLFPAQTHVRLRGLSAYVVSDHPENLYNAAVRVPQAGTIRYMDGAAISVDQTAIPVVRIGRLQTRLAVREADIVATMSAFNASPIGHWRLVITDDQTPPKIDDKPNTGRSGNWLNLSPATLQDVTLDLHLAVRSA